MIQHHITSASFLAPGIGSYISCGMIGCRMRISDTKRMLLSMFRVCLEAWRTRPSTWWTLEKGAVVTVTLAGLCNVAKDFIRRARRTSSDGSSDAPETGKCDFIGNNLYLLTWLR